MCSHGLTRFSAIAYVSGTKHLEIQLTQRFMAVPESPWTVKKLLSLVYQLTRETRPEIARVG